MTEGTHIPGTPACGEWEAQLADALDGLLKPEEEARFVAHKASCPACAEMYEAGAQGPRVAGISFARAGAARGAV